jgi:hypothetical protein
LSLVLVSQILLIILSTSQMKILVTIFAIIGPCSAIFIASITAKYTPLCQYKEVFMLAVPLSPWVISQTALPFLSPAFQDEHQ